MSEIYDVLIIGGGPGGMYSSIIGSFTNISSVIIESNPFLGGQPMQLYAHKNIYDFPGFFEILPAHLINGMIEQIKNLNLKPKIYLNSEIKSIEKNNNIFFSCLSSNEIIKSKFIIIATGQGIFSPIKDEILDNCNFDNIDYIFGHPTRYKDKKIIILGGGDSALDWSNYLIENKITSDVSIIHRRSEFRSREEKIHKLKINMVKKFMNYKITNIFEEYIEIESNELNEIKKISYDFIIVQYGQKLKEMHHIELFNQFKKHNKKIEVDINCLSSIENIYAIGNSISYDSKPNLIISACSDGARAIYHIRDTIKKT